MNMKCETSAFIRRHALKTETIQNDAARNHRRRKEKIMKLEKAIPAVAAAFAAFSVFAGAPKTENFDPESMGWKVIAKLNPLEYAEKGCAVDNTEIYSGNLKRIAYSLKLTDKQGVRTWAFVSMDPFSQDLTKVAVPTPDSGIQQLFVENLEVRGNAPNLQTGKFSKGNIEFWAGNYSGENVKNIPGATNAFDFGDAPAAPGDGYGSMQVHNFLRKQTVFAFNNFKAGKQCDLGIGGNPDKSGNPDWTFSASGKNFDDAELLVLGKFENLKINQIVKLDPQKVVCSGVSSKMFYKPGETMKFTVSVDFGDQPEPTKPCFLEWVRTGDDGKTLSGKAPVAPGKPVVIKTSLDQPGFVRIEAWLANEKGQKIQKRNNQNHLEDIRFDGGAGVQPNKLRAAAKEPRDFDAFWDKQKKKLNAVPVAFRMEKAATGNHAEVYAVSVDCAGPRPVTGYLTIPIGAKDKSMPAYVFYQGYGTYVPAPLPDGPDNCIQFHVNAHGVDLGKDQAYYDEFFESLKSNGAIYAFDKQQNSNPETAYFNGMALRVMRSLQFLKALPQWNGKDLVACGGSQGGLQTIWAAALDPDVSRAESEITWCCDLAGSTKGRLPGWRPDYDPALNYYDAVFHAKRIKCPILIPRAGLGDYICPPSGLAVLYNNIASKDKKIKWFQGSTHGFVPQNPQTLLIESEK